MELFNDPVSETIRSNQRWLKENGESFLTHQRRVDQITAEILGLKYENYINSRQEHRDETRKDRKD